MLEPPPPPSFNIRLRTPHPYPATAKHMIINIYTERMSQDPYLPLQWRRPHVGMHGFRAGGRVETAGEIRMIVEVASVLVRGGYVSYFVPLDLVPEAIVGLFCALGVEAACPSPFVMLAVPPTTLPSRLSRLSCIQRKRADPGWPAKSCTMDTAFPYLLLGVSGF